MSVCLPASTGVSASTCALAAMRALTLCAAASDEGRLQERVFERDGGE